MRRGGNHLVGARGGDWRVGIGSEENKARRASVVNDSEPFRAPSLRNIWSKRYSARGCLGIGPHFPCLNSNAIQTTEIAESAQILIPSPIFAQPNTALHY